MGPLWRRGWLSDEDIGIDHTSDCDNKAKKVRQHQLYLIIFILQHPGSTPMGSDASKQNDIDIIDSIGTSMVILCIRPPKAWFLSNLFGQVV